MSFLSGIVNKVISSSGLVLPFIIEEKLDAPPAAGLWTLHRGTKRDDRSNLTIFSLDLNTKKDRKELAQNALKRAKTIRHPDMIKLVDSVETENHIYMATEPVLPLSMFLKADQNENNITMGIYKIASSLKFFHSDCKMVHGNVRLDSVYVTNAGEWKLFGYELLGPLNVERPLLLEMGNVMLQSSIYNPPEVQRSGMGALRSMNPSLLDSWALGALMYEIYNGSISRIDQLTPRDGGKIPAKMFHLYRMLVVPDPTARGTVAQMVEFGLRSGNAFDNDLIQTVEFLDKISVKELAEKEAFGKKISAALEQAKTNPSNSPFPPEFLKYRLLPSLSNSIEFGGAPANFLSILLRIGELLNPKEYDSQLAPIILRLFSSMDRELRLALCDNMPLYIGHFPNKAASDKIWPNIQTGFSDTSPALRLATVKAMLPLAPHLSEKILNNDLLSLIARAQIDSEPGIRANTTICLGKLSKLLSEQTRSNVLIPAFSRALIDTFPPSRVAGLMAFSTTIEYYEPESMARTIVPAVVPLLIDTEKSVRAQAAKTFEHFLQPIKAFAAKMPDSLPAAVMAGEKNTTATGAGPQAVAPHEARSTRTTDDASESWSNWAGNRIQSIAGSAVTKLVGVEDFESQVLAKQPQPITTAAILATPSNSTAFAGGVLQPEPLVPVQTFSGGMKLPKKPNKVLDTQGWDQPQNPWDQFSPTATAASKPSAAQSSAAPNSFQNSLSAGQPEWSQTLTKSDNSATSWDQWGNDDVFSTSAATRVTTTQATLANKPFQSQFMPASSTPAFSSTASGAAPSSAAAPDFSNTSWDSFQASQTNSSNQTFTVNLNLKSTSSAKPNRKY